MAHGEVEALHHERAEAQGRPEDAESPVPARRHRLERAPDPGIDRQEALAVGGVAAGVMRELVGDDRRDLVAPHQGEKGQRHVEDAPGDRPLAGLQHRRARRDEEPVGQADDQGLGLERAHPLGQPLDQAPEPRRLGGGDRAAEDRQGIGLERVEGAAQAEHGAARGDERRADRDGGDRQELHPVAGQPALDQHSGLERDDGDEGGGRRQDLDREGRRQEPAHQREAPHQRVARAAPEPAEAGAGEQHEEREPGRDRAAADRHRRQQAAPLHHGDQGAGAIPGLARLGHREGTAVELAVMAELQAEIDAAVAGGAGLQVGDDLGEAPVLGGEGRAVVEAARPLPQAEEQQDERQQDGGRDEAGQGARTRRRAWNRCLGNGRLLTRGRSEADATQGTSDERKTIGHRPSRHIDRSAG